MHSFLKKTLSLSLALSLLAGAAGATPLTGLETATVERDWASSLFFPLRCGFYIFPVIRFFNCHFHYSFSFTAFSSP